jgi:hypothetical protein
MHVRFDDHQFMQYRKTVISYRANHTKLVQVNTPCVQISSFLMFEQLTRIVASGPQTVKHGKPQQSTPVFSGTGNHHPTWPPVTEILAYFYLPLFQPMTSPDFGFLPPCHNGSNRDIKVSSADVMIHLSKTNDNELAKIRSETTTISWVLSKCVVTTAVLLTQVSTELCKKPNVYEAHFHHPAALSYRQKALGIHWTAG